MIRSIIAGRRIALSCLAVLVALQLSCGRGSDQAGHFPEVGEKAIQQRALALRSNLKVLSIALEPGLEDLRALAYFRVNRGAAVISAYVSNGEAGRNDVRWEYPNYLAATRRSEAEEALSILDGDVHFLNNPHIIAARDSNYVRDKWPRRELIEQFISLIDNYKPDIVLIGHDWTGLSLPARLVRDDVLAAIHSRQGAGEGNGGSFWRVSRVLGPVVGRDIIPWDAASLAAPGDDYLALADEAGQVYASLRNQRPRWLAAHEPQYGILFSVTENRDARLDGNLPPRHTLRVREIAERVAAIADGVQEEDPESFLSDMVSVLDTLSMSVGRRYDFPEVDRRALFHWKTALEALKCSILGVEARYEVSEKLLTMSQLSYVTVADVMGLDPDGETTVFFGGIDRNWAVNEDYEKRFKYVRGDQYRLLTPNELELTLPVAKNGLDDAKPAKTLTLYVLHEATTKERSFIYRSPFKLRFGPKFATEVLTPIVRMVPGEKLIVRLTNFSRDGVRDTVAVKHEQVESMPGLFRLNQKDGTWLDTLSLIWQKDLPEGNYLYPIEIDGIEVANFAARKFSAAVDTARKVGVVSALSPDILSATLRRLGVGYRRIDAAFDPGALDGLDVVIVDAHFPLAAGPLDRRRKELDGFVSGGGHLIYLAQNPAEWRASGLWEQVTVLPRQIFDEGTPVDYDADHPMLSSPNQITPEDWQGWLFTRAPCSVEIKDGSATTPVRTVAGEPLLATQMAGSGRKTYVALALPVQLANIHSGAFRILANLISN